MAGVVTKMEKGVWLDEDFEVCVTVERLRLPLTRSARK
jgi:hypothetical protein